MPAHPTVAAARCEHQLEKECRAMVTMTDLAGYIASTMVLLTFMTKDMRNLRILAITSNVAFITYGMLVWLPPVLCLHLLLLPLNALRLREMFMNGKLPVGRVFADFLQEIWGIPASRQGSGVIASQ
jgi:hypothetical protein